MVLNKHNHITGSRLRDARILANKTAKEVGLFIETETFRDFIFKCLLARENAICENNI